MPKLTSIEVRKLNLDLKNFRTVPQKTEYDAIKAMISIKPDRFYAIIESMIEDGYLPTENIIVLEDSNNYIVKEGNRRVAALKLIHGIHKAENFELPSSILKNIERVSQEWIKDNTKIPCTIYSVEESDMVDKIVTLTHGKGEKASRDSWSSVARARHNRDFKKSTENGLDILEKYLVFGNNVTKQQKDRWAGDYNITVLDEALRKIFPRIGEKSVADLVEKYPKISYHNEIECILHDIGLEQIKFETIRKSDFLTNYGIPQQVIPSPTATSHNSNLNQTIPVANSSTSEQNTPSLTQEVTVSANPQGNNNANQNIPLTSTTVAKQPKAVALNDPKNVTNLLKKFIPKGDNRQKVVTLRDELKSLKIDNNPIAFCFILRSMLEISAKAYLQENNLKIKHKGGKNKTLKELLTDVYNHLIKNNTDPDFVKNLHGANVELNKSDNVLSVTSMNQLVHSLNFSIVPRDICIIFVHIYPLLELMN